MESWGVVIVAVVGVVGTVAGSWIQGHHARRAAEEARLFEREESLRPLRLEAFALVLQAFAAMDRHVQAPTESRDPLSDLHAEVRVAELTVARFAALVPSEVAAAARAVLDGYRSINHFPISETEHDRFLTYRDAFVASFRRYSVG